MFMVADSRKDRRAKIKRFVTPNDIAIAVLLSAADFEWTVRRAILGLGNSPNRIIRDRFEKEQTSGLRAYGAVWADEVALRFGKRLPEIVPDWARLRGRHFPLRNRIIHGVIGTTGLHYATESVDAIWRATDAILDFSSSHNVDLNDRLPVRRKAVLR